MESQQELQQMAYFLQFAEEQLKELELQRQVMDNGIQDIATTLYTIDQIEAQDPRSDGTVETLVPLGSGTHVATVMQKPSSIIVPIGARYFVERAFADGKELLLKQQRKMEETREIIGQRMKQLVEQAEKVRPILNQRMESMEQGAARPPSRVNLGDL